MSQLKHIKVATPTYDDVVPSSRKKVKLKPFRVGDEKVLLLASESKEPKQMINALKQVVGNCVSNIDVDDLATYDLEYLFVKLRAVSVGETTKIEVKCTQCEAPNPVEIDLSKLKVTFDKDHKSTIRISDNLGFEMKPMSIDNIGDAQSDDIESMLEVIARSVKTVFYGDETFDIGEDEIADLKNIINELTSEQFGKVQEYFTKAPKLVEDIEFDCVNCKEHNTQRLEGLASFF